MIYLIVGLDRRTHAQWHRNVSAGDSGTAKRIARARARSEAIDLVVAAVVGPHSTVILDPAEEWTSESRAA